MDIIAVYDGKSGHKSQLDGVVAQLSENNHSQAIKIVTGNYFLSFLPRLFAKVSFFIPKAKRKEIDCYISSIEEKSKDKKILILAIGRRTLATSLYIKKIAKQKQFNPFLVYLMPPAFRVKEIDLVFFHSYKRKIDSAKNGFLPTIYEPVIMPPHNVNIGQIKQLKQQSINQQNHTSTTAVLIGGDAKDIIFSKKSVKDLLELLQQIYEKSHDDFIIVTSRRTPPKIEKYLYEQLQLLNNINVKFFGYHVSFNDVGNTNNVSTSNNINIENPYLFALANANKVVVTGESVSMLAESCALDSKVDVIVFFSKNFCAKRYMNFHKVLYENSYAMSQSEYLNKSQNEVSNRKSINVTKYIVDIIVKNFNSI